MARLRLMKKSNDLREFEVLIENHLDSMYVVALRYTRDPSKAEDLVHDTVVRALRFRERFELGTNFKAWINTVLTHTFIHRYRRQKKERELLQGATRYDVDRQLHSEQARQLATAPEHAYLDQLLSDDVLAALDSLPDEFRKVVVLCDIEGLSYKEISEALDCPVGTVMSRLYRARRLLERKLANTAIEQGIIKSKDTVEQSESEVFDISKYRRRKEA